MIGFLRFIGVLNAAVWFGTAVFFLLAVNPAFSSLEMDQLIGRKYAGAAAQIVAERYYTVQLWCGLIALIHQLLEWLYTSKPLEKLRLYLILGLLALGLIGGYVIHPKLQRLYLVMHGGHATPEEVETARESYGIWHGTARVLHAIVLIGIGGYLWRVTYPPETPRFIPLNKFV